MIEEIVDVCQSPQMVVGAICSQPKIADKQPEFTGFPFTIFAPESVVAKVLSKYKQYLLNHGVVFTKETPPFLRTDIAYVRISFRYGDVKHATTLYDPLKDEGQDLVFKNWL